MTITTEQEKRILQRQVEFAAILLRNAADMFSNHSCNDFDLAEVIKTKEETLEFVKAWNAEEGPYENSEIDEFDYNTLRGVISDYSLMEWCAKGLDKLAKDGGAP